MTRREDFDRVFANGRVEHGHALSARFLPDEGAVRVGFIVGKRVSAKATVRNRTKRRLRAIVGARLAELHEGQLVVIAKSGAEALSYEALEAELLTLLKRTKSL